MPALRLNVSSEDWKGVAFFLRLLKLILKPPFHTAMLPVSTSLNICYQLVKSSISDTFYLVIYFSVERHGNFPNRKTHGRGS